MTLSSSNASLAVTRCFFLSSPRIEITPGLACMRSYLQKCNQQSHWKYFFSLSRNFLAHFVIKIGLNLVTFSPVLSSSRKTLWTNTKLMMITRCLSKYWLSVVCGPAWGDDMSDTWHTAPSITSAPWLSRLLIIQSNDNTQHWSDNSLNVRRPAAFFISVCHPLNNITIRL